MSALDFDRTTLDPRDLSYERQFAQLESEGWELEDGGGGSSDESSTFRYFRRHRRITEIERLFKEKGQRLRFNHEDDGTWTVAVLAGPLPDSSTEQEAGGATPQDAAEAAWVQFGYG
jgi:hypothetical protein